MNQGNLNFYLGNYLMTYIDREHDFIAYPLSTSPNLETWALTIGSVLIAFGVAYWAHIKFASLDVASLFQ